MINLLSAVMIIINDYFLCCVTYLDHIYHTNVASLLCGPLCDDGHLLML